MAKKVKMAIAMPKISTGRRPTESVAAPSTGAEMKWHAESEARKVELTVTA